MSFQPIRILKRCKSLCEVTKPEEYHDDHDHRSASESSEAYVVDSGSEFEEEKPDGDILAGLERKIDMLSDVFLEQCRLLTEIKDEIRDSKTIIEKSEQAQNQFIAELLKQALSEKSTEGKQLEPVGLATFSSRARSLLDAIETRQGGLDRAVREALLDCLHSDELKERMVSATAASVREMLGDNFSREMSRLYVPILQREHRRLARQLTRAIDDAFVELESHSTQLTNSMCRVSRSLRRALQRHQGLMEAGKNTRFSYMQYLVENTLQKEIHQWRHLAVEALCADADNDLDAHWLSIEHQGSENAVDVPMEYPISPPQPADPDISIIDQLMTTAEINKLIQDGDMNAAFERALSAADLSLVMAACRAADPSKVFYPCRLQQSTLLSLAQQLPTDMVHDTQLKCR
ncbi:enhancer of mRNA-decapping protein 4-like [Phthorimaea operculella]|nr:enhancer of mRNA-decapping protein 4-like [Phthorimaea operculella]